MIGKRIYDLRKERGLTQSRISELADISREQINRYENDKVVPDFSTVVKLAKVLEVSVNSILSGPECDREITDEKMILRIYDHPGEARVRQAVDSVNSLVKGAVRGAGHPDDQREQ